MIYCLFKENVYQILGVFCQSYIHGIWNTENKEE